MVRAVTCAWIGQWITAKATGDDKRVQEAVTALKSAQSWKILHEMSKEGAYPGVVWEVAAMASSGKQPEAVKMYFGCK